MSTVRIGAHVSIAGGIPLAVERAKNLGCNAVQIFSGSPRVWQRSTLPETDRQAFLVKQQELDVSPVVTHALYLVNLVSENPALVQKSVQVLKHDLTFDSKIQGSGVVVHLGSHQGRGWEAVRENLVKNITEILADTPEDSTFLIENSASKNGKLCTDLADICWLLDQVQSPRLGWCFDTCHGFSAGYAPPQALETMEKLNLFASLKCVHVNDSRDPFDSGRDRHANLGQGSIPESEFREFVGHPEIRKLPLILEVPGFDNEGPDKQNVDILKSWLS